MPRLRKLPEKDDKLEMDIPIEKDVQITIGEDEKVKIEASGETPQATEDIQAEKTTPETKVEPKDPSEDLKEQLRLAQEAHKAAQKAAEDEKQARLRAEKAAEESKKEVVRFKTEAEQSHYDAIINAIGNAQAESDAATRDYELAMQAQDFKAAAEAQKRFTRSETRLVQLEDGKVALESRRESQKKQETTAQSDPLEAALQAFPQNAQKWLREHSDYMTNERKNAEIRVAHWKVLDTGVQAYSDDYLSKLEIELGLRKTPDKKEVKENTKIVAAPPSRGATANGNQLQGTYTLTAAEREAARMSGISDVEYLKQKLRIEQEKSTTH